MNSGDDIAAFDVQGMGPPEMILKLLGLTVLAAVSASMLNGQDAPRIHSSVSVAKIEAPDFNSTIYYRNKLEYSTEMGWLPINIPFVFDFVVGSPYTTWPMKYTMVPTINSLRWHVDGIHGRGILRGDTDFTFSGSFTAIPRGPESKYYAFDYGIRRNFVPRNSHLVPFFDARGGVGRIDAQGPHGVLYAQGQDLTFTLMMGSGARYNFNSRYSISFGATYMHVSNFYLSEPKYENFGINVWGPMVGFNVRIDKGPPIFRRQPVVFSRTEDGGGVGRDVVSRPGQQ